MCGRLDWLLGSNSSTQTEVNCSAERDLHTCTLAQGTLAMGTSAMADRYDAVVLACSLLVRCGRLPVPACVMTVHTYKCVFVAYARLLSLPICIHRRGYIAQVLIGLTLWSCRSNQQQGVQQHT